MKITENMTRFYAGKSLEQEQGAGNQKAKQTRLFTGGMEETLETRIMARREEAVQKAKKLLGDVFAAEKTIDDDLAERANRIKESEQKIVEANKKLRELEEEQEKLKEQYGITAGAPETEEYRMQYAELEYYGTPYRQTITEAQKVINEERMVIEAVKVERLKSNPMVGASKEAENIMESANDEIVEMIADEVKETVDKTMEEAKEKQELAEEKKELEEAKRKEREERKEQADISNVPMQELLELENMKGEMKQEVDTMLTEMKLLVEDIKGSVVDEIG